MAQLDPPLGPLGAVRHSSVFNWVARGGAALMGKADLWLMGDDADPPTKLIRSPILDAWGR